MGLENMWLCSGLIRQMSCFGQNSTEQAHPLRADVGRVLIVLDAPADDVEHHVGPRPRGKEREENPEQPGPAAGRSDFSSDFFLPETAGRKIGKCCKCL